MTLELFISVSLSFAMTSIWTSSVFGACAPAVKPVIVTAHSSNRTTRLRLIILNSRCLGVEMLRDFVKHRAYAIIGLSASEKNYSLSSPDKGFLLQESSRRTERIQ